MVNIVIENFMRRNLPDRWFESVQNLYGISAKIVDGDSDKKFRDQAEQIFKEADQAKIHKYAWGYHYSRNKNEATAEATKAAQVCNTNNVEMYMVNAEKHFFGTWGEPIVPEPDKNALHFVETFRKVAPDVQLGWNGFSTSKIGKRNAVTKEVAEQFEVWLPMCYGALGPKSSAVERTLKWREEIPHQAIAPTVDCKADFEAIKKFVSYTNPDFLNVWLGNGGKDYFEPVAKWSILLP